MLNFFDFEVYKYDWLVVIINPFEESNVAIANDKDKLKAYYDAHKDQIWVSYNGRVYDQYIIRAILLGFNPKEVNDYIIVKGLPGWKFSDLFRRIPFFNYDAMNSYHSLKTLEGFMGNNIKETSVPFDIDRKLTPEEIEQTIIYCTHDVKQLMEVFIQTKPDFDAHMALLKTFNLPLSNISKTKAQLSALALGCVRKDWIDEWDLQIVPTLRISKYKQVLDWFIDPLNDDYSNSLKVDVCGVPHVFGWGGIHGAPDYPVHKKGLILHVDVTSFYPTIMIKYDMLSRNVKDKSVYKQIYDTRVALKKAGKKAEQAPYKIILNATYGICKDPSSAAYDPRQANNVCVNGQLLLLDLLEHLEGHCEVIQSNTDGLIIQIEDTDEAFDQVDDICYEWESRTGMSLGFDIITEIWQKDVNNYLFKFENGTIERKGAWVKELNNLDNDLPIVNEALVQYMVNGVPVEKTIMECNHLREFQKIVKVSSKFICGFHNGQKQSDKTFRVFASVDPNDSFIGKVKIKKGVEAVEKFANTPEHCFIWNDEVNFVDVPAKLDKKYYVDIAKARLKAFGI